jgi:hypothetical protein
VILSASQFAQSQIVDPGIADTVRIDSLAISGVGSAQIPIHVYNDEQLGGLEITFYYSSDDIQVDSISFAGGRLASIPTKGFTKNDSNVTLYCLPFPSPLASGNGVVATVFVSFSPSLPPRIVRFDSTTVSFLGTDHSTVFSTASAQTFRPQFRRGTLSINACCVGIRGNANNDSEQRLTIHDLVFLVNFVFRNGQASICLEEGNANGSQPEKVTVADLVFMVNYLFRNGPFPPACPQ